MGKELKYLLIALIGYGLFLYTLTLFHDTDILLIYWINILSSYMVAYLALRIAFKRGRPVIAYYLCGLSFLTYTSFSLLLFSDNDYFNIYAYHYMSLFLELFLGMTVAYITVYYVFHEIKPAYHMISTLLIFLPVWFYFSNKFFLNHEFIFQIRSYEPLIYFKLKIMTFRLFILALFWAYYLKSDKIFTQYLSSLMFGLSILVGFSILHNYSFISTLDIHEYGQYWMLGILLFIVITLQFKLYSITGNFGPVYERILVYSTEYFTRRRGYFDRFICWCFFSREEIEKPLFVKKE